MAASGGPVQDLFEEATCSICLEYFKDPVIIPECGHNFCRACLIQYWGKSEGEASCPECRKTVQQRNLIPNRSLANVAEKAKMLRGDFCGRKRAEGMERVCEKHQEPLKLFCKEDESPICLVCERSKEHKSHEVIPLEEASQEYMNQICRCLGHLRKEREKIMAFKMDAEEESQDLLNQVEAEMEKTVAEFRRLRRFLEEQEKRLLFQMAEVEKEIAKKREEQLARLSGELSSLESLIQEVEEKLQEPASELLQDIGSFLWRYQEKFEDPPIAFPPALKWRIWDFGDINPFLEGVMKQFRDTLGSGFQLQQENVTLDPDTAHPHLILSEDRKRVRFGDEEQDLPNNCERFDKHPYVLGGEGFTGGRHFWEVVVGSEGGWAVGVARKSVKRKGQITFGPEEGVWGLGKWAGEYKASSHAAMTLSKEPERIRVALNCEGGRVSFYDADRAALLCTFSAAPFSGETLLPLFWVPRKAHLTLSDGSLPTMASAQPSAYIVEEARCPLCKEYFTDPVSVDCGHSFCWGCIKEHVVNWNVLWTLRCPVCSAVLQKGKFRANWQLANIVERIKLLPLNLEKRELCESHSEKLSLFCKEDEKLVCELCRESEEHWTHTLLPPEESVQGYKDRLYSCLETLKKEREKVLSCKADTKRESKVLLKQTKAKRKKTLLEFRQLRQFLEEQEKLMLAQLKQAEMEIRWKRDERMAQLSGELFALECVLREVEKKRQQTAGELLQDIKSFLQRCEEKEAFENPEAFSPELKWRIWDFCDKTSFLEGAMKQFKDTLVFGVKVQEEHITLDPDTAHPNLILSEDHKSLRWGDECQERPDNPERFDKTPFVLGREGFTSGRHFWDFAVGSDGGWAVGVTRKSLSRKGVLSLNSKEGIWAVGKLGSRYSATNNPHYSPLTLSGELKRIRVFLNVEGGRVAFFDADSGVPLFTFSGASFSGETLLPLVFLRDKAHLTLSPGDGKLSLTGQDDIALLGS
uniref:uncharacterized protein LOC114590986 n=1 Tax=Podarcis muralis TaxID=64176 RepID=UPI00109FDF2E|nr:uncharacterized protein LOC114590986 [Podarcis muralis]